MRRGTSAPVPPAVADGNRFGLEIMDTTGLTSGTVLSDARQAGIAGLPDVALGRSHDRAPRQASAAPVLRPDRRRCDGAQQRAQTLQEPQASLPDGVAHPAERGMTGMTGRTGRRGPLLRLLLAVIDTG
jgi:hypothetical protein